LDFLQKRRIARSTVNVLAVSALLFGVSTQSVLPALHRQLAALTIKLPCCSF